jgi:hypothetical protein
MWRSTYVTFEFVDFLGMCRVRRAFMRRFSVFLHGTLGSSLLDALQEGGAAIVACLHAPRA